MYSPLRYPGGKGKIYGKICSLIELNNFNNKIYIEPFAGGFSIGIRLLFEGIVQKVMLNDLDRHIYNFWKCVLDHTEELCALIRETEITLEERKKQLEIYKSNESTILQDGFATLFLNRVNYSGIIKGGPIGGLKQNGKYLLHCRFNKTKIISLIRQIAECRDKIIISNKDAIVFMRENVLPIGSQAFLNIDPPYVMKGSQLYTNYFKGSEPHGILAKFIQEELSKTLWIVTYDNAKIIKDLYSSYNPIEYELTHTAGRTHKGQELVITNILNFAW